MYSKTVDYLEKFDNPHDFERMSAAILIALGCQKVGPIAPRGGSDGGKDIVYEGINSVRGLACVTLQDAKGIEDKFYRDLSKRQPGEYDEYIFFCTAPLTASQKFQFTQYCLNTLRAMLTIYDLEALALLLDNDIRLRKVKETYLYVDDQEMQRRLRLIALLYQEYRASHDGIPPDLYAGTAPLPKEWAERQLEKRGETWRMDVYKLY